MFVGPRINAYVVLLWARKHFRQRVQQYKGSEVGSYSWCAKGVKETLKEQAQGWTVTCPRPYTLVVELNRTLASVFPVHCYTYKQGRHAWKMGFSDQGQCSQGYSVRGERSFYGPEWDKTSLMRWDVEGD